MINENITLHIRELIQAEDERILHKWLTDPEVLEFYEGRNKLFDLEKVKRKFFNRGNEVKRCMVVYKGKEIGYIQYYPINSDTSNLSDYHGIVGVYGMDQFIGETEFWNKGIGTLLVTSMVDYLFKEENATRIIMDPMTSNDRAIRCYEKCGFKIVKVLPKHMLHEGAYRDCWLMECTRMS